MSDKKNKKKNNAVGLGVGGQVVIQNITVNTMKLGTISNPLNDDQIYIQRAGGGDPEPVTTDARVYDGDAILCEPEASGSVVADDGSGFVNLVSFSGDDPATVEVDWSHVTSVDEYYNGSGQTYEIGVDSNETFTIVG